LSKFIKGHFVLESDSADYSLSKLAQAIQRKKIKGIEDLVATREQLLIISPLKLKKLKKSLEDLELSHDNKLSWEIPIHFFEEADWARVAEHSGLSRKQFIDKFLAQKLQVEMFGFIPGFIYLEGLDKSLMVPRKENPSLNQNANVLAIGGSYAGIYSLPSSAGWNIIGQSPIDILSLNHNPPLPFSIGDDIIFKSISSKEYDKLKNRVLNIKTYNA
jgi:KipI family sensor histidine kinase inhibitor